MKGFIKNTGILLVIYIILAIAGLILKTSFNIGIDFRQTAFVLTGGLIISFFVSAIFYSGFAKSENVRVQRTLLAVGLKFLLYGALAGLAALWFKKLTVPFLLTFFVIYLAFTIYLMVNFINVLKY